MLKTKIKLLHPNAEIPKRAHPTDTGYDIKLLSVDKIIGDTIFFLTGISLTPPEGFYWEIVPRSNISQHSLQLANSIGVIDDIYTGQLIIPVRVLHPNLGQDVKNVSFPNGIIKFLNYKPISMAELGSLIIKERPKMFQLILRKRYDSEFEEVDELDVTERGDGGFGSTNK